MTVALPVRQAVVETGPGDLYVLSMYRDQFGVYVGEESLCDGYTHSWRYPGWIPAAKLYESLVEEFGGRG